MVCNVFIFREISELLWEGSTKGIVLMYSLIISWHLLDGDAVWGDASFPVFQKAMDYSFELIDTVQRRKQGTTSMYLQCNSTHPDTLCLLYQAHSLREPTRT